MYLQPDKKRCAIVFGLKFRAGPNGSSSVLSLFPQPNYGAHHNKLSLLGDPDFPDAFGGDFRLGKWRLAAQAV